MNRRPVKMKINLDVLALIYFALFLIAVWFGTERKTFRFPEAGPGFLEHHLWDLLIAGAAAGAVIGVTYLTTRWIAPFREMVGYFQGLLSPLNRQEIFMISAFSAVAEEFFFRGFLQAEIGLVAASFLFGLLHLGPSRKFIPWTLFAVALGFLFGGLYAWRGNLLVPVFMHFLINYGNLSVLQKFKTGAPRA